MDAASTRMKPTLGGTPVVTKAPVRIDRVASNGVPQSRHRVFVICVRRDLAEPATFRNLEAKSHRPHCVAPGRCSPIGTARRGTARSSAEPSVSPTRSHRVHGVNTTLRAVRDTRCLARSRARVVPPSIVRGQEETKPIPDAGAETDRPSDGFPPPNGHVPTWIPCQVSRTLVPTWHFAPAQSSGRLHRHPFHHPFGDARMPQQSSHQSFRIRPTPPVVMSWEHYRCRRRPCSCIAAVSGEYRIDPDDRRQRPNGLVLIRRDQLRPDQPGQHIDPVVLVDAFRSRQHHPPNAAVSMYVPDVGQRLHSYPSAASVTHQLGDHLTRKTSAAARATDRVPHHGCNIRRPRTCDDEGPLVQIPQEKRLTSNRRQVQLGYVS